MKLNVSVRLIEPRTWKGKSSEGYNVEGLLLETGADFTLGKTIPFTTPAESQAEAQRVAAAFSGKSAVFVVKDVTVNFKGEAQLVGHLEAATAAK